MAPPAMKMLSVSLAVILLAASLHSGAAVSLRAAPTKATPQTAPVTQKREPAEVAKAVAEQVAKTVAKALAANITAPAVNASSTEKAAPVQHKKLDVGFSDFEKNLTEEISAKLLRSASGTAWNDDMKAQFAKNVTDALHESLKVILKPVKQSIGKTWMALPKDSQKDEYVESLKSSFVPVFENSMKTINSHLDMSLKRVEAYSQEKTPLAPTELLEKSEHSVADSLITEHCYEVSAKKNLKSMKKPANSSEVLADKKKFCIQSVIGALAHRLNDTQGLISMSMRFDAGAMSLAQKKAKGLAH